MDKLEMIIKMGSPECQKFIEPIRMIPGNDEIKNLLILQLEDFDFDASIVTFTELSKNLGNSKTGGEKT
jgi:hypothetical protein